MSPPEEALTTENRIERLRALLDDVFGRRAGVTTWAGRVPAKDSAAIALAAGQIGYPKSSWHGSPTAFVPRSPHEAAVTLAMLATQSQAHEFNRPPPATLSGRIEMALGELLPTGRFVSNADHLVPWIPASPPAERQARSGGFQAGATRVVTFGVKLSDATFDTGVIGFDGELGFIAWAEEED